MYHNQNFCQYFFGGGLVLFSGTLYNCYMNYDFLYETHMHTKEASACAVSSGAEMADYYKKAGYTGIVVTDHFFNGNCAVGPVLAWRERVELFCGGYEQAKKRGDEIDLDVFFGFEWNYAGTEFLVYNLDKQWLRENPQIMQMDLCDVLALFRAAGGFVIHAHPFRRVYYIDMFRLIPDRVDAVEAFNSGHTHYGATANRMAEIYAAAYHLPATAGSDRHAAFADGRHSGVALPFRAGNLAELSDMIAGGDTELMCDGSQRRYNTDIIV